MQDRDLAKLSREELAKYRLHVVGMVFQSFNLIASMTLAENVELPLRFAEVDRSRRDDLAREALERVGLGGEVNSSAQRAFRRGATTGCAGPGPHQSSKTTAG